MYFGNLQQNFYTKTILLTTQSRDKGATEVPVFLLCYELRLYLDCLFSHKFFSNFRVPFFSKLTLWIVTLRQTKSRKCPNGNDWKCFFFRNVLIERNFRFFSNSNVKRKSRLSMYTIHPVKTHSEKIYYRNEIRDLTHSLEYYLVSRSHIVTQLF